MTTQTNNKEEADFILKNENQFCMVAIKKETGEMFLRLEDFSKDKDEIETLCGLSKMDDFEDEFNFKVCEVLKYE